MRIVSAQILSQIQSKIMKLVDERTCFATVTYIWAIKELLISFLNWHMSFIFDKRNKSSLKKGNKDKSTVFATNI